MVLFGLVPMFVGIAQIIIAVLSGAQLPGVRPHDVHPAAAPAAGTGRAAASAAARLRGRAAADAPAVGRAGRAFEELSKPVQPPDVR